MNKHYQYKPASRRRVFLCKKMKMMYYNESTIIYCNGKFIRAVDARANMYDQSLHYGYAVFEGIRAYDTDKGLNIFKAAEHYNRLQFSADAIGIPYPYENEALIQISYELMNRNKFRNAYLRPILTCSPNMSLTKARESQLSILAWVWDAYLGNQLLRLKTSSYRRITPASFKVEAKVSGHYVNSILATQEAKDSGFDEALLLDADGYVAEGPGANVFIEKNGILFTPQRGSILPGITRSTVFEICKELDIEVAESRITVQDVYESDSCFYCGTAAEIIGIESLDKKPFRLQWEASLSAVIQRAYKKIVAGKEISTEKVA